MTLETPKTKNSESWIQVIISKNPGLTEDQAETKIEEKSLSTDVVRAEHWQV